MNYYNEIDPFCCEWLQNLIDAGEIPDGTIDSRSIANVRPDDLLGYEQCHFFAGVGGWNLALRLAGWPADRPVWTGSCPCQPFSSAGKQKGTADERHLWPAFFRLIRECRPPVVFGEQVASAIRLGWLDGVCGDLEAEGYACGAAVLGAHSVQAPHIRQRLYWVADSECPESGMRDGQEQETGVGRDRLAVDGEAGGMVFPDSTGLQPGSCSTEATGHGRAAESTSPWSDFRIVQCRDGKARRIGTGVQPLAHGIPRSLGPGLAGLRGVAKDARRNRVGRLKGYGNAIVPQVAAEFVRAYLETTSNMQRRRGTEDRAR